MRVRMWSGRIHNRVQVCIASFQLLRGADMYAVVRLRLIAEDRTAGRICCAGGEGVMFVRINLHARYKLLRMMSVMRRCDAAQRARCLLAADCYACRSMLATIPAVGSDAVVYGRGSRFSARYSDIFRAISRLDRAPKLIFCKRYLSARRATISPAVWIDLGTLAECTLQPFPLQKTAQPYINSPGKVLS